MAQRSAVVGTLLEQGRTIYTCKSLRDGDGNPLVLRIQKIPVLDFATSGLVPYALVAAAKQGGEGAARARQRALEQAAAEVNPGDVDAGMKLVAKIIEWGCPELGRVHLSIEACPKDPETGLRTELVWTDLDADFFLLSEAILELSTPKEVAEKARTFPG